MEPERATDQADARVERCELCVVGAGIGGLNALFAASRHLSPRDRVLMVDRHPRVGGMWNTTYGYVRLHQPHPMFTVGNIAWDWSKPRSHLATREEVLGHLGRCFDTLARELKLELYGGYECTHHEEDESRGVVRIHCRPVEAGGAPVCIEAKRLVDAVSFGVSPKQPLPLSSRQVRSVSPDLDDLLDGELARSKEPVYIVGGGKTAMDTAYALIRRFPGRPVRLLVGAGTMFMRRDDIYVTGLRRYVGGTLPVEVFRDLAQHFDGDNELAVMDYFRERYAVALDPRCRRHMFGLLSVAENETISRGADEVVMDYLEDVIDRDDKPVLRLRSGDERAVEPGSWFVNATGYFKESPHGYLPFRSESGRVLAINPRSVFALLPAYAGYLMVYAAYQGLLERLPVYEFDSVHGREASGDAFMITVATHMMHNVSLVMSALPGAGRRDFGPDTNRWYPLHRQLAAAMRLTLFQKQHPDHLRKNLDRLRERFGLRLGPLPH